MMDGITASVRDLIKICANVKGGVHFSLGKARTLEQNILLDWDRAFTLLGEEPSQRAIAGVSRIVVRGLIPLADEITRESQSRRRS